MAQQKQHKQPNLIDGARMFLLTVSNQYNAYKLILQLMV